MARHKQYNSDIDGDLFGNIPQVDNSAEQTGPVTVLGLTFADDEERRAYFRAELRAKLPELRQIEGFPIGSDDDIINLSDPPYYTACPNPWLKDFIAEWEQEKRQLEADGKRRKDFEVKIPYAVSTKSGKNSAIYNAHGYHTKVPHEIIMRYILHYTQPGDIIVDSFCGTGMTGVASNACGQPSYEIKSEIETDFRINRFNNPQWGVRHAICGDLSPLCYHIATNYNSNKSLKRLKKAINIIIEKTLERFGHFYTYKSVINGRIIEGHINYFVWSEIVGCKQCGHPINVHDYSFDYETNTLYKELVCPICGTKQVRTEAEQLKETVFDRFLNQAVSQTKYECCLINYSLEKKGRFFTSDFEKPIYPPFVGILPLQQFGQGDKYSDPKRVGIEYIHQLYFERTQYVLAYIYDLIKDYSEEKEALMFIFTSMLPKLTKMNRYMPQHGSRALVGPMANTLYVPPQCVENNPIDQFAYQANKVLKAFKECHSGSAVQISSATQTNIPNNSIDYIFTDPPFGANIMYSELNIVSESWLNVWTNNKEEAISNKTQHKGFAEYHQIMTRSFEEYFRVLKPGKWMTVEFSNTSAAFWNGLQFAIRNAGFVIASVNSLDKERGGLHSMISTTAVKQDLAISCYKPSDQLLNDFADSSSSAETVWNFIEELLQHLPIHISDSMTTLEIVERSPRILFDRLISYYVQRGFPVPIDAKEFQNGLRERFLERDGMFFTADQAFEYEAKKKETTGFEAAQTLFVSSEAEGIEWLKRELQEPKTYADLTNPWNTAQITPRKGDRIPELKTILEENFIEDEDGRWRVPDPEKEADLEKIRNRRLAHEFKLIVEEANKPKSRIRDARLEALRYGFTEAYRAKDFETIVKVAHKLPEALVMEDEVLLRYYDIAINHV